jgi:hypothetical protein
VRCRGSTIIADRTIDECAHNAVSDQLHALRAKCFVDSHVLPIEIQNQAVFDRAQNSVGAVEGR